MLYEIGIAKLKYKKILISVNSRQCFVLYSFFFLLEKKKLRKTMLNLKDREITSGVVIYWSIERRLV